MVFTEDPETTGTALIEYETVAPPVEAGAVNETFAVVVPPLGTVPTTFVGADGAVALTPIVTVAVPVSAVPLGKVV